MELITPGTLLLVVLATVVGFFVYGAWPRSDQTGSALPANGPKEN